MNGSNLTAKGGGGGGHWPNLTFEFLWGMGSRILEVTTPFVWGGVADRTSCEWKMGYRAI